mmetsp:Transcript_25611/g.80858  ORF Transcript_25611/g.80858 Transcript_25611/m.80858 type:complete len:207 (-) Transcript_25611:1137-1757(-)
MRARRCSRKRAKSMVSSQESSVTMISAVAVRLLAALNEMKKLSTSVPVKVLKVIELMSARNAFRLVGNRKAEKSVRWVHSQYRCDSSEPATQQPSSRYVASALSHHRQESAMEQFAPAKPTAQPQVPSKRQTPCPAPALQPSKAAQSPLPYTSQHPSAGRSGAGDGGGGGDGGGDGDGASLLPTSLLPAASLPVAPPSAEAAFRTE